MSAYSIRDPAQVLPFGQLVYRKKKDARRDRRQLPWQPERGNIVWIRFETADCTALLAYMYNGKDWQMVKNYPHMSSTSNTTTRLAQQNLTLPRKRLGVRLYKTEYTVD